MVTSNKVSLIPKANKKKVYENLFNEGVMVVQKDPKLPKHKYLDVPNLQVMMILKSLASLKYVSEKFNWQHYYYILTNEGVEFLRDYLNLPSFVSPDTYTKIRKPNNPRAERPRRDDFQRGGGFGRGRTQNTE